MSLANITTKRQALTALRKLGWKKSELQMTRNATTYTPGGRPGPMIVLSDSQHIITGCGPFNSISVMPTRLAEQHAALIALGIIDADAPTLNPMAFAVAVATALNMGVRQC